MSSRLTSVELPLGKQLGYGYDPVGRRTRLVDQDGGWTTWTFDAAGRTTVVLNPFGETTSSVYDAVGRQVDREAVLLTCSIGRSVVGLGARRSSPMSAPKS